MMDSVGKGKIGNQIPGIQFCVKQVLDTESLGFARRDDKAAHPSSFIYSSAFKPYATIPAQSCVNDKEQRQSDSEKPSPFSPECSVPLPFQLGDDYGFYAIDSLWKRNERERHRVRCVNEGYERLRSHLPLHNKQKRISKVETLRLAIRYIKYLEDLLSDNENSVARATFEDPMSKERNGG